MDYVGEGKDLVIHLESIWSPHRTGRGAFESSSILSELWAVSNFVAFCLDWPLALGPQIHIFCPDQDQGFPAIAGGPHMPC